MHNHPISLFHNSKTFQTTYQDNKRPNLLKILGIALGLFAQPAAAQLSQRVAYTPTLPLASALSLLAPEAAQEPIQPQCTAFESEYAELRAAAPTEHINKLIKATVIGLGKGIEDILNTIAHPVDEFLYPISELLYDATILTLHDESFLRAAPKQRMHQRLAHLQSLGHHLAQEPWEKGAETLSRLGTNIFVPGAFLNSVKMAMNVHQLGVPFKPPKFHNTIDDALPNIPFKNMASDLRKITQETELMYVLTEAGELIIHPQVTSFIVERAGGIRTNLILHPELSKLQPIYSAGTVIINEFGKIVYIDNRSGHFLPNGKILPYITERAFIKKGYREAKGTFVDQFPNIQKHNPLGTTPIITQDKLGFPRSSTIPGAWSALHAQTHPEPVQAIKQIIASADISADIDEDQSEFLIQLQEIAAQAPEGQTYENSLTPQEMSVLENAYSQTQVNLVHRLTEAVGNFADDVNAVFDQRTFQTRAYTDRAAGQDTLSGPLSSLHILANVFSLFAPQKVATVQKTIQHGTDVLKGASTMIEVFGEMGLAALRDTLFAAASGNFVVGFSGLMSLFGQNDAVDIDQERFEAVMHAMQCLSNQVMRMHEDMLEAFRQTSLTLSLMREENALNFAHLQILINRYQQQQLTLLNDMQHYLYVDRVYSEEILASVNKVKQQQYVEKIDSADWSKEVSKVRTHCKVYKNSLSLERLREDLLLLVDTLNEVQKNSLARSKLAVADPRELYDRLSASSDLVGGDRGNQNIHLFHAHIVKRFNGKDVMKKLPPATALHNRAALSGNSQRCEGARCALYRCVHST